MQGDVEELIQYVGRFLLERPDYLEIETRQNDGRTEVLVSVHENDRGRIIGRGGQTAQALRALVRASGGLNEDQFRMQILD
jgi:predicted RNA-binding protein YlqC (UPF0109 family)